MVLSSTSNIMVEWAPPKFLLSVSPSPGGVPVASWFSSRFFKQVGVTQAPSQLLPLCWVTEQVRFYKHPLRVESLSPVALWSPKHKLIFKAWCSVVSSSLCRILMWDQTPRSLGRTSAVCDIPAVCGQLTSGVLLQTVLCLCPFYASDVTPPLYL